jgi:5'-nucleotidase
MTKQGTKPNILVVNDDGITATGIKNLMEVMQGLGNVVVVAPDSPAKRNGTCHYNR